MPTVPAMPVLCLCYAYCACNMPTVPIYNHPKTEIGNEIYVTAKYYLLFSFKNFAINEFDFDLYVFEFEFDKKTEFVEFKSIGWFFSFLPWNSGTARTSLSFEFKFVATIAMPTQDYKY